jgi:hypothetical protein
VRCMPLRGFVANGWDCLITSEGKVSGSLQSSFVITDSLPLISTKLAGSQRKDLPSPDGPVSV